MRNNFVVYDIQTFTIKYSIKTNQDELHSIIQLSNEQLITIGKSSFQIWNNDYKSEALISGLKKHYRKIIEISNKRLIAYTYGLITVFTEGLVELKTIFLKQDNCKTIIKGKEEIIVLFSTGEIVLDLYDINTFENTKTILSKSNSKSNYIDIIQLNEERVLIVNMNLQYFEIINIKTGEYETMIKQYQTYTYPLNTSFVNIDNSKLLFTSRGFLFEFNLELYSIRAKDYIQMKYLKIFGFKQKIIVFY